VTLQTLVTFAIIAAALLNPPQPAICIIGPILIEAGFPTRPACGFDAELVDVLDTLGKPDAVTLSQMIERATGTDAADWLMDRRNRRAIPHRMERCGYVQVRNPDADDGRWKLQDKRQVVYAKADLSLREQIAAVRRLGAGPCSP
jgi:hypothetical protein